MRRVLSKTESRLLIGRYLDLREIGLSKDGATVVFRPTAAHLSVLELALNL